MKKLICLCLASLLCLAGCSGSPKSPTSGGDSLFKAGTYTGTGKGNNDSITVEVTFTDTEIASITIKEHQETAGISDPAIQQMPAKIIEAQSSKVDAISNATITSNAIKQAVENALR